MMLNLTVLNFKSGHYYVQVVKAKTKIKHRRKGGKIKESDKEQKERMFANI